MTDGKPINREDYKYFNSITTRWMDNDVYGHVNNVTYYSYFDTTANQYLIEQAGLDIHNAPIIGFVVHSNCNYLSSIAYPDKIEAGLYVKKLGNSSVTYGVGIFKKGENTACAFGEFVHVFVNRAEKKSVSIPEKMRIAMKNLMFH
jgi:acyl-CoA thioester hydrolase